MKSQCNLVFCIIWIKAFLLFDCVRENERERTVFVNCLYHNYPAIKLCLLFFISRMTQNILICVKKFCYEIVFSLLKQSKKSRSILDLDFGIILEGKKTDVDFFGLFWEKKENTIQWSR